MATQSASDSSPVTRIATFRFRDEVTPAQKGDRTAAFLALYAEYPELLVEGPKGGRPLNTPLNLTNVKRESVWDTGFVVVFKVSQFYFVSCVVCWIEEGESRRTWMVVGK